jgi:hypothetical protein
MTVVFPNQAAQAVVTSLVHKAKQSVYEAKTNLYKNKAYIYFTNPLLKIKK